LKSIQAKMTIMMLAICLGSLALLGGMNYWRALGIITDNVVQNMQKQASVSARDVGNWLDTRKAEISFISSAPEIQRGQAQEIFPFLKSIAQDHPLYGIMGYIYPDGTTISTLGKPVNLGDRAYFKQAMKGEICVSDPLVAKSGSDLLSVIAVPVKVDGKVTGVVYGSVNMQGLTQQVLEIKAGKTGYAMLTQADGLRIVHPDPEIAMKDNPLKNPDLSLEQKAMNEHMVAGDTGVVRISNNGVESFTAYAPVPGVHWSLGVTVPVSEMTGVVSSLTVISLVTIVIVLIIAALLIAWYARKIAKPIRKIEVVANQIAAGDVRPLELNIFTEDEIGRLGQTFGKMTDNLRQLIQQILGVTDQVAASSQELTASAEQSAQAANQVAGSITAVAEGATSQLKAVENSSAVIGQMANHLQQAVTTANKVAGKSVQALEKATEGRKSVSEAITHMTQIRETVDSSAQIVEKLGERSKEIGQIVDVIASIAGQTNLLALNAAIEAARAGEQGKGFAVVAEEVRKLAEQSQEAAKKIAELIGVVQTDTNQAVAAMDVGTDKVKIGSEVVNIAGKVFQEIETLVIEVSEQVKEISAAIQQNAVNSQQIVSSVKEIDVLSKKAVEETETVSAATQEQSASIQEIASASQVLANIAKNLQQVVSKFQV
jgi:methyl-accepting chemotaxis protein